MKADAETNDTSYPGLAARVREARGKLTQAEFGAMLGITKDSVGLYERGSVVPGTPVIISISNLLAISPTWLLLGQGPKHLGNIEALPVVRQPLDPMLEIWGEAWLAINEVCDALGKDWPQLKRFDVATQLCKMELEAQSQGGTCLKPAQIIQFVRKIA